MKYEFLRKIPLFAGLSDEDLHQMCQSIEEVHLPAGEMLFSEGSSGQKAYVIQEGTLEVLKASSGRDVLLAVRGPGEVIGEIALLESSPRMAGVRARTDSILYAIQKEDLDRLLATSVSAANALFGTILKRWRSTEAKLRQSEKMAQLGTLTAGVAHELNNPAAAAWRGASQLQECLATMEEAQMGLSRASLDPVQLEFLQSLAERARLHAPKPAMLDAVARSDRQYELETWLEEQGVEEAWELAPTLVDLDYDESSLAELLARFDHEQLGLVIRWLYATYTVYNLLSEIMQAAGRISEIVKALKSYAYLDQAPIQNVDIHEGMDSTLLILRNKLKAGIRVVREYSPGLPKIHGYGSELNQVWTNLIDNAIDALDGQGQITLRTRQEGDWVVVEVEDNGPGISPDILPRIFDPFFTTKPPGKGTGLGLDISFNIVVNKHRGDIRVTSHPGQTNFQVWLPLNFEKAEARADSR